MRHENPFKISYTSPTVRNTLQQRLLTLLESVNQQPIVIICIGTDRSTGDALGPLVGTQLEKYRSNQFHIYGTIENPVHALNLQDTIQTIQTKHSNPFIIAIDACLGQATSVGFIQAHEGPVKPGAGVNKTLPEVGHMHITGVVNVGGFMEYLVLQNTRLHIVLAMADIISYSLYCSIIKHNKSTTPVNMIIGR